MAATDWKHLADQTNARMAVMRKSLPTVSKGFAELAKAAIEPGVLDSKTKELIALALGVAARCDGCIVFHIRAAVKYGATRDEIAEAMGVVIYLGGGPAAIYAAEALSTYDQLYGQPAA